MTTITIRDVAVKAGVSKATVSRSFNQPDLVDGETLKRVLGVASEMGFYPNAMARGLVTGKSGIVGLIIPDITNPYFGYIARGCSDELSNKNLTVALYSTSEESSREYSTRYLLQQQHVDGLIIISEAASVSRLVESLPSFSSPTVYIEREPDHPAIDAVCFDNVRAASLAADHLIGLGHRKIGIVTGLMNTTSGKNRLQGFVSSLQRAGIQIPENFIIEGDFKLEGGARAARKIMGLADPPTAIFVCSDLMAYGAMGEFLASGWRIPEKISIIGCEDLPFSSYFSPKLTTVKVPIYEIGVRAASLLIKRLKKPSMKGKREMLGVELAARQSTCMLSDQPVIMKMKGN
jgi:LacI family transcriptional regulator